MSVEEKRGTAFVVMQFTEPAPRRRWISGRSSKKKPRAVKECQQRSVMIGGKRVKAGLDISEILLEKDGHISLVPDGVFRWRSQVAKAENLIRGGSRLAPKRQRRLPRSRSLEMSAAVSRQAPYHPCCLGRPVGVCFFHAGAAVNRR